MHRRIAALAVAMLMTLTAAAHGESLSEAPDKYDEMPAIFAVTVETAERYLGEKQAYINSETLTTTNAAVNADIKSIVDSYDAKYADTLQLAKKNKGLHQSMLDLDVVWYRTGDAYISTMVLARVAFQNEQLALESVTNTYDLRTGEHLLLTDIFAKDSGAWDLLGERVREHLTTIFPDESRDESVIDRMCSQEALENAKFTLSAMELTLYYPLEELFPEKHQQTPVRFFYPELTGMMTDTGRTATDNSKWKMISVTCDDGPKDYASTKALNSFRRVGARATYFIVGHQLDKYGYLFIRQVDQNMLFGSHTWNHWSGYTYSKASSRRAELEKCNADMIKLVGYGAKYFRCPGGTYPPWIEANMPVPIIQWSLDTKDFTGKKPDIIFQKIREDVKDGDIILVHDTGKYEHAAIPLYGEWLTEHGYMMVTLDELAAYEGAELQDNVVYWSFRGGKSSEKE